MSRSKFRPSAQKTAHRSSATPKTPPGSHSVAADAIDPIPPFSVADDTEITPMPSTQNTNGFTLTTDEGVSFPTENLAQVEMQKSAAAARLIKAELEKAGLLNNPDIRDSLKQVLKHCQTPLSDAEPSSSTVKTVRQQIVTLAQELRQIEDLETLFETVALRMYALLQVDRAVLFRFQDSGKGTVMAECLREGWTPMQGEDLAALCFGVNQADEYGRRQVVAIDDIYQIRFSPYQTQLLEKFQIKASLALPIWVDEAVWGLLVIQQCDSARPWQEQEISLLYHTTTELTLKLQSADLRQQLEFQIQQEQLTGRIIDRIRQSLNLEGLFRITVREVRQFLKADRVGVFYFNPESGFDYGEIIAEDVAPGYTSAMQVRIEDHCFGSQYAEKYLEGRIQSVADIHNAGLTDCHVDVLAKFQVRANLIVPFLKGRDLWGLLCIHQCSGPRHWKDYEIRLVQRIAAQFTIALQQVQYLEQMAAQTERLKTLTERQRIVGRIIERMRESLSIEAIFRTTVKEVRQFLNADRVGVFQFREGNYDHGVFVAEDVVPGYTAAMQAQIYDHCFGSDYAESYRQGRIQAVTDVLNSNLTDCHVDVLTQFQIRANLIVPLLKGRYLWGLLCINQCSGPREWQEEEITLTKQIADQFTIALQQVQYVEQIEAKSQQIEAAMQRDKTVARIIDRIRESPDLGTIFRVTVREIRRLLLCDRVGVFKFIPGTNYNSGEFVAEDVVQGYVSAMQSPIHDHCFGAQYAEKYKEGRIQALENIYEAGLTDCHLDVLAQFQVQANLIVPLLKGGDLWGLLCIHQCKAPRLWQEHEIEFTKQIAAQFCVALQQREYVEQLESQATLLSQVTDRANIYSKLTYTLGLALVQEDLSFDTLLQSALREVRRQVQTDRVAVYRFNADWSGEFVVEDVGTGWVKLVGTELAQVKDTYLQENKGGRFRRNECYTVADIYHNGLSDCHIELLERWGTKAHIIAPILKGEQLWGLLGAYQNDNPRPWSELEVNLLAQVGIQIGVALQQTDALEQARIQAQQLSAAAEREKILKEELQQGVMRLLSAVRPALKGDLTVRAPVTEDEVGTIADAYNNTLQSLRKIVLQVQEAATKVGQTSQANSAAITDLSQQAQRETQEIAHTLRQIQAMVEVNQVVATNAQQVNVAVQQANQTVQEGDVAMNRTVDSILGIRETVAETSKKIKRLSESSQKISKVVNLISNFTTQTQLLALNAAIEATRAGEYGRGFAVVADEVRSLARQSADATTEIEKLVQEIQIETSGVAAAMEAGIEQVVSGTNLVNETRQSLNAIVTATAQISQLVQAITGATQEQTRQSETVTQTMTDVAEIVNQTSSNAVQISASFQTLVATAEELLASVGQFKVN